MDPQALRRTDVADVMIGMGASAVQLAWWASRPVRSVGGFLLDGVLLTGAASRAADRGRRVRLELERAAEVLLQAVVVRVVPVVLVALDLPELVRKYVDIPAIAAEVDIDAVVQDIDLDAIVAQVDLNAAVARVDLDAVVQRIDLNAIVAGLDLDGLVATVDLDRLVATVDLNAVVGRVDLNAVVRGVDIDAVVQQVDLDAAITRMDLAGIARDVIAAVDLPEIVRDSTGALSSDAVRTVRAEGMQADDVVAGFVDRVLRRRQARPSAAQ